MTCGAVSSPRAACNLFRRSIGHLSNGVVRRGWQPPLLDGSSKGLDSNQARRPLAALDVGNSLSDDRGSAQGLSFNRTLWRSSSPWVIHSVVKRTE
jgi:hypothetical protein